MTCPASRCSGRSTPGWRWRPSRTTPRRSGSGRASGSRSRRSRSWGSIRSCSRRSRYASPGWDGCRCGPSARRTPWKCRASATTWSSTWTPGRTPRHPCSSGAERSRPWRSCAPGWKRSRNRRWRCSGCRTRGWRGTSASWSCWTRRTPPPRRAGSAPRWRSTGPREWTRRRCGRWPRGWSARWRSAPRRPVSWTCSSSRAAGPGPPLSRERPRRRAPGNRTATTRGGGGAGASWSRRSARRCAAASRSTWSPPPSWCWRRSRSPPPASWTAGPSPRPTESGPGATSPPGPSSRSGWPGSGPKCWERGRWAWRRTSSSWAATPSWRRR